MSSKQGFWLVWNPQGRQPMYRHSTYASAVAEARRLAGNNPGHEFYVLGCLGRAVKVEVEYKEISSLPDQFDEDELPF